MFKAIDLAVSEEILRRENSFRSVKKLHELFVQVVENAESIDNLKEGAIQLIQSDIRFQEELDSYYKENFSVGNFPLRTNKNGLLFQKAIEFLGGDVDLLSDNLFQGLRLDPKEVNKLESDNENGTSLLNIVQIALMASLRALSDIADITDLNIKLGDDLYEPVHSPVMQGVPLPDEHFVGFENSSFYYDAKNNELLTPNLGYAFGGSRGHDRYEDKIFRTEDCSSAVAKWVSAPGTFATYAMKMAHKGNCEGDDLCANVQAALTPKSDEAYEIGDVFVKGFHTGLISAALNET